MLQSIRDRTHGWIAGIIISILILSFALWGIHSYLLGNVSNVTVAKVNGVEVTKGQLAVAYERLRRQLQMQYSSNYALPENAEANLKARALQTLINIQVLKQASLAQKYRISTRQIDSFLESIPEFQVNGQFSVAKFQQLLATTLYNANDFLELIQTSLLIDQPRLGMIFSSFALPNEVETAVALVNQERDIQFVVLPLQTFSNHPILISNDKVLSYYNQHPEEFKTPEQVSVEYIELSLKDLMANMHPADAELKSFYTENTNSFAEPMQWKLDVILIPNGTSDKQNKEAENKANEISQKIKQGASFADLSHQYPVDIAKKLKDWVTLNQIPTELQQPILKLTKKGQVSEVFKTTHGFVILKVMDFKEAQVQPFEKVKDKVKDALNHQQAEEKLTALKEKLANKVYEHPESLQPAAKELGLTVKTSELFTKDKGGKDISANNKVREAAFSSEVLNLQNNSDVISLTSDDVVVIRVKSHQAATLLALKTVEKQITEKLNASEADAETLRFANEIVDQLHKGNTPDQVANQYKLKWNPVGFITRHSTKVDPAILETAFATPKPTDKHPNYSIVKVSTGYAVIALNAVRDGNLKNNPAQAQVFAEQLQNTQGMLEYELYKQSLIKKAKIVIENQDKEVKL